MLFSENAFINLDQLPDHPVNVVSGQEVAIVQTEGNAGGPSFLSAKWPSCFAQAITFEPNATEHLANQPEGTELRAQARAIQAGEGEIEIECGRTVAPGEFNSGAIFLHRVAIKVTLPLDETI